MQFLLVFSDVKGRESPLGSVHGKNRLHLLAGLDKILAYGAIAQLGERLHGMQEVVGSNPIGSISYSTAPSSYDELL